MTTEGVPTEAWFDVERFRRTAHRQIVIRRVTEPTVVLGSTQPDSVLDARRVAGAGVHVLRRRSGGGAVYLAHGDPVWFDVWVPTSDALWDADVGRAPAWVGRWWSTVVEGLRPITTLVQRATILRDEWSERACFAGIGPGEVTVGKRKLVGLAQWRCRQGSLFHVCMYRRWYEAAPLADLLALPEEDRAKARSVLSSRGIGFEDRAVLGPNTEADRVVTALLLRLPPGEDWEVLRD